MIFSKFKNKRILVTGHTGFKGSWITSWLSDLGAEVSGIALDPLPGRGAFRDAMVDSRLKNDVRLDIRRPIVFGEAIKSLAPEIVFHLAAQPLVIKSYHDPLKSFDTNVMGTAYLLEALRSTPSVKGVVCITTDKVYENKEIQDGYSESDQLGGYDPYSASKAACEIVIASYARSFFNKIGIPVVAVRAGNVIGGGDWAENRIVPDFFRSLESSKALQMRSPKSTRPWQHVMEPLSGYLTVANAILIGKLREYDVYNFGPKTDAQLPVSKIVEGLNASVTRTKQYAAVPVQYVDSSFHETSLLWLKCDKAKFKLGWEPRLNIQDTLELTSEFYVKSLDGASANDLRRLMSAQIAGYMERMPKID